MKTKQSSNELLKKILFEDNTLDNSNFKNISLDHLIKTSTNHLVLPSLYYNIKKKKLKKKFPNDFIKYSKYIYKNNFKKNKSLILECKKIASLFNKNNINYCFIKGASLLLCNVYQSIGERMIGDIDILVDSSQLIKAHSLLATMGYVSGGKYSYISSEFRYYDRQINKENDVAIELHRRAIEIKKHEYLNSSDILANKHSLNNIYLPRIDHMFLINIYSFQINDFGYFRLSYNYRNIYDSHLILKKLNGISKIKFNKVIQNYFIVCKFLNIRIINKIIKKSYLMLRLRFFLKNNFKTFRVFDDFITTQSVKTRYIRTKNFIQIFKNGHYRGYLIKKLTGDS